MLIISLILFFTCYYFCFTKRTGLLSISVFIFTTYFLYGLFGAYFITIIPELTINNWVLLCGLLYFYFYFFSFIYLLSYSLPGVLIHSLIMVGVTFLKIIFPIHPLILLYPHAERFLPATESTFLNLLLLFFLSGVLFCRCNITLRVTYLLIPVLFLIITNSQYREPKKTNLKIAIVQVGLYFEKGGSTTRFFRDFMDFLHLHPEVNAIAFSENNFFSYKSEYNKYMSEKLISDIQENKLHHKYHLILSFSGYKDFNNIITLYQFSGLTKLNQKKTLIPFIEKPGVFNSKNSISSEFYSINKSQKNSILNVMGNTVSTHICYDALFPETHNNDSDIILIQSNYKLLNHGYGFERLQHIATYLAKFINGLKSNIVINIQNTGGTVVIYDGWRVDSEIYEVSKTEPFFVVDTSKL